MRRYRRRDNTVHVYIYILFDFYFLKSYTKTSEKKPYWKHRRLWVTDIINPPRKTKDAEARRQDVYIHVQCCLKYQYYQGSWCHIMEVALWIPVSLLDWKGEALLFHLFSKHDWTLQTKCKSGYYTDVIPTIIIEFITDLNIFFISHTLIL